MGTSPGELTVWKQQGSAEERALLQQQTFCVQH